MISEVSPYKPSSATPPTSEDREGAEIRRWLGVMTHGWAVLLTGAVAGALLGVLAAARTPPTYEAVSTVILTPPLDPTGLFTAPGMQALFSSPSVSSDAVKDLGLDRPPHGLTPEAFRSHAFVIEPIPNTYMTRLRVRLSDPQLAAKAATHVTELVVDLTARVWRQRVGAQQATLERQVEAAREGLAKAEQDWTAARLQLTAAGRKVRVDVPRGIAYGDPDRRFRANQPKTEERLAESRERGETLAETQRQLQRAGTAGTPDEINRAYSSEFDLVRRENEVEVKRLVYSMLAERLEATRVELVSNPSPLGAVGAVTVPQDPLQRTSRRTIAVGLLAGLVLAACTVVVRESRARTA
jgi:uncharacterized protein involved in exopolysaccharide biosynthesis